MKIVVKIGTNSILADDGSPREEVLSDLVQQIVELHRHNHRIALVSSGAVGFGRKVASSVLNDDYGANIGEKQLLASLGQHEIMHIYSDRFKQFGMLAFQVLLSRLDFHTERHHLNISRLLHEILRYGNFIPIINENDSVAVQELMFTDNDELAGIIAEQIVADKLIILTNVRGVYDGDPKDSSAKVIPLIDPRTNWPEISPNKSAQGRGGMVSKLKTARKMSGIGITTHITSSYESSVLVRIIDGEDLGTKIVALKNQERSITINDFLYEVLNEHESSVNVYPAAIDCYTGTFQSGDIVSIFNREAIKIGYGIARYDSKALHELVGHKAKEPFIKYKDLYIA